MCSQGIESRKRACGAGKSAEAGSRALSILRKHGAKYLVTRDRLPVATQNDTRLVRGLSFWVAKRANNFARVRESKSGAMFSVSENCELGLRPRRTWVSREL